jgi:5,10-methylene-tetrahydrofolate dehydrogenase/methenyl tetrahydrofolate cyclohydrolase
MILNKYTKGDEMYVLNKQKTCYKLKIHFKYYKFTFMINNTDVNLKRCILRIL